MELKSPSKVSKKSHQDDMDDELSELPDIPIPKKLDSVLKNRRTSSPSLIDRSVEHIHLRHNSILGTKQSTISLQKKTGIEDPFHGVGFTDPKIYKRRSVIHLIYHERHPVVVKVTPKIINTNKRSQYDLIQRDKPAETREDLIIFLAKENSEEELMTLAMDYATSAFHVASEEDHMIVNAKAVSNSHSSHSGTTNATTTTTTSGTPEAGAHARIKEEEDRIDRAAICLETIIYLVLQHNRPLPDTMKAFSMLLEIYGGFEDWNLAVIVAKKFCYVYGEEMVTPHCAHAWCLRKLGRFEDAIRAANEGLRLFPKSEILYSIRGDCKYTLNKYKDSIHDFDQAICLSREAHNEVICMSSLKSWISKKRLPIEIMLKPSES